MSEINEENSREKGIGKEWQGMNARNELCR